MTAKQRTVCAIGHSNRSAAARGEPDRQAEESDPRCCVLSSRSSAAPFYQPQAAWWHEVKFDGYRPQLRRLIRGAGAPQGNFTDGKFVTAK
jgi:hypothetical protein